MKIVGDVLLKQLKQAASGLGDNNMINQSAMFVFRDGKVLTFNGEVSCSIDASFGDMEGVVNSRPLLNLLERVGSNPIAITADGEKLTMKMGKREKATLTMEAEVLLPIDDVEFPEKADWRKLPDDFMDALSVVLKSVGKDQLYKQLTCVHFNPKYLESCDNSQLLRWTMDTGVSEAYMVKGSSLRAIMGFAAEEMAETSAWLHFRSGDSVISLRRMIEEYSNKDAILICEGESIELPDGLTEAVSRASVFKDDTRENKDDVKVSLKSGMMIVVGQGQDGQYEKALEMNYDGKPFSFCVDSQLFVEVLQKSNVIVVGERKMKVTTDQFEYIVCLEA